MIHSVMMSIKVFLRFLDRSFVVKLFLIALLYSLLPLSEIFLLIYLGGRIGNYLTLALAALTGLLGMVVALREFQKNLASLKAKIRQGAYPGREFVTLTGILIGGLLLLTPGFITDACGFLLFVPAIRNAAGGAVVSRMQTHLKDLYEYLKLYDL
jgi:UPF0716 protein FxsA